MTEYSDGVMAHAVMDPEGHYMFFQRNLMINLWSYLPSNIVSTLLVSENQTGLWTISSLTLFSPTIYLLLTNYWNKYEATWDCTELLLEKHMKTQIRKELS